MYIKLAPVRLIIVIYKLGHENTKSCLLQSSKNVSFGVLELGILSYTEFTEDSATDVYLEVTGSYLPYTNRILHIYCVFLVNKSLVHKVTLCTRFKAFTENRFTRIALT